MWTRDIAQLLAREEVPKGLTEEHWKVISCLRGYYLKFGVPPPVAKLQKDTGFNLKLIYALFPSGPGKGAVKIAGLPRPPGLYPQ
jgi:TusE/DsrC/DsvC family sulfur relay protein